MTEVLLFIGTASLLVFGAGTVIIATLALRTARRYVELAEERMERLREGQARLSRLPADERRVPEEATREHQGLSEALDRELLARRDAERRIEHLKRELVRLREAQKESPLPAVPRSSKGRQGTPVFAEKETLPGRNAREDDGASPTSFLETSARKPAGGPPNGGRPRLGVKHPHPDDAITGPTPPRQARARSATPVEMFRKHYDKYLENYRGYVELAEHLYRTRDAGEIEPGTFEEQHWEERLRRVNDGIARTIARLDILEGQNPDLAADDLVSSRARVARRHSELGGDGETAGRS